MQICRKNLCKNCSSDCKKGNNKLIDLHKELDESKKFSLDIKNIISQYLIKPEKKPINFIEKDDFDYSFD